LRQIGTAQPLDPSAPTNEAQEGQELNSRALLSHSHQQQGTRFFFAQTGTPANFGDAAAE
jgi:hypothetical protein